MSTVIHPEVVNRVFDPSRHSMPDEVARWLVELRADNDLQARFDELADKNTEGTITPDELDEYDAYLQISSVVAVFQAHARDVLARRNGN